MKDALVSVIMPAFNAEKFIAEAIQSILDQDYPTFELLVVNDGSTDKTREIIEGFKDERIRYFEQTNKGVSAARNVGLDNMKGDFFCFLDADDVLTENGVSSRLEKFSSEVDVVMGAREERDETLKFVVYKHQPPSDLSNLKKRLAKLDRSVFFGCVPFLIKSEGFKDRFEEGWSHCEDLVFCLSLYEKTINTTMETVQWYRRHSGSAMEDHVGLAKGYILFLKKIIEDRVLSPAELMTVRWKLFRMNFLTLARDGRVFYALKWGINYFLIR